MVCPKCETVLKNGEKVCPICGTPVGAESGKMAFNKNSTSNQFTAGEFGDKGDIKNTVDSSDMPLPQNHDTMPNKEKKNSMRILTVITVLAIVIITTLIAVCFVLMNQSSKKMSVNTVDADTKYTEALQADGVQKQEKSNSVDAGLSKSTDDANADTNADTDIAGSVVTDDEAAFFKAAAGGYTFASGAGGWATSLDIDENGRFEGSYHDSEMGAGGDNYDATMYVSNFSGQLSDVRKISDLEYTAYVESIEYQDTIGDQEIKDRVLYIYTSANGIEYGRTLHFYMKGSDTGDMDEHLIDWLAMPLAWGSDMPKILPFNAFYNEEDDAGFFGNQE